MEKKETIKKKVSDINLLTDEAPQPEIGFVAEEKSIEEKKEKAPALTLSESVKGITEKQAEKVAKAIDPKLSFEERIEAFIEDKNDWVKLNDFLKSLYPIPKFNEPPAYLDKGEMKRMRILLDNMQSHGKIQLKNSGHSKLGNHYYEGEQQHAKFYHIGNLTIEAKK